MQQYLFSSLILFSSFPLWPQGSLPSLTKSWVDKMRFKLTFFAKKGQQLLYFLLHLFLVFVSFSCMKTNGVSWHLKGLCGKSIGWISIMFCMGGSYLAWNCMEEVRERGKKKWFCLFAVVVYGFPLSTP